MADHESIRQAAQTRIPFSAWFGMVLLFLLFGAIVLAVIGPSQRGPDFEQTRVKKRLDALKTVQDEQKSLTAYGWVDKNKGTLRIPVERAMELTMADLARRKPTAAYAIAASSPAATTAAAGPAGPTPAAPARPAEPKGSPSAKGQETNQSEVGNQPAAAVTPRPAAPGTQPGANATPAASPGAPSRNAPVAPSPSPKLSPPGSPLPVRGNAPQSPVPSPSP